MIKILINDYAGHPFITKLSDLLSQNGYEVIHSYFADDIGPKGKMQSDNFKFVGIRNKEPYDKANFIKRYFGDLEYGKSLSTLIKNEKPDIIFSSNTPPEAQKFAMNAAKQINSKFIFWVQDLYSEAVPKILKKKLGFIGSLIGIYYKNLEKKLLEGSDSIIVISEDFLNVLKEMNLKLDNVHVIENWGTLDSSVLHGKSNKWSTENNLDPEKFRVLYSGTLGFKHNPDHLIKLASNFKEIEFLIIASGVGFEYLKKNNLPSNIRLMDLQPFERFAEVLGSSDVCIALLEDDAGIYSVPSKVLSYLCAGKPILMHGPKENLASRNIEKNKCGLISSPKNFKELQNNLSSMIQGDSIKLMSSNAKDYADKNFSAKSIEEKFKSIIKKYKEI